MKTVFKSLYMLAFFACADKHVYSQVNDKISDELYQKIIVHYLSIYTPIEEGYSIDRNKFTGLFQNNKVPLDNDFCDEEGYAKVLEGPGDYLNYLIASFGIGNTNVFSDFSVTLPRHKNELLFCQENNFYHVWVHKIIRFKYYGNAKTVDTWARLKILATGSDYKIVEIRREARPVDPDNDNVPNMTIGKVICDICENTRKKSNENVTINGCINNDIDEDGVPDTIDDCKTVKGSPKTHGCPDRDNDGIRDIDDSCPDSKGSRINSGCPISRLELTIAGGVMQPFGSAFSGKTILNNQNYTWDNNSNLATLGVLYDVALHYQFSTFMGIEAGGLNFTNKFDTKRLQLNIEAFLANNSINYNYVSIVSNAYQFNMAYFKLCFGNFSSDKHIFKIEPCIGYALNGFSNNETTLRISYQNSGDAVKVLSFKSDPFLLYGGDIKYEFWIPGSILGLMIRCYFLTGETMFTPQEASFENHSSTLQFHNQKMKNAGVSLGLLFNLVHGNEHYKKR